MVRPPISALLMLGGLALALMRHRVLFLSIFTASPFPTTDAAVGLALKLLTSLGPDHLQYFNTSHDGFKHAVHEYRERAKLGDWLLGMAFVGPRLSDQETRTLRVNDITSVVVSPCAGRQVVVYFHGGGTVIGSGHDSVFSFLGLSSYCVFGVNYPLAPEHPYPSGVESSYEALVFAQENAFDKGLALGADRSKGITIMGVSAGGIITAVVALMAKDRSYPPISHQILVVPMLFPSLVSHSFLEAWDDHILDAKQMSWFWYLYLGEKTAYECTREKYCAPLAATTGELKGLPRATILVGSHDVLRDDGIHYHRELTKAGVRANLERVTHSHMLPMYRQYLDIIADKIRSD